MGSTCSADVESLDDTEIKRLREEVLGDERDE